MGRETPDAQQGPTPTDHPAAQWRALSALRALRNPVVAGFFLAAFFDTISGNPLAHGLSLVLVATAIAWESARSPSRAPRTAPRVPSWLRGSPWTAGAVLVYATIAGGFGRYSWPATIAVGVPGAVAVAVAWRGADADRSRVLDRAGIAAWAAVVVALSLWELAALFLQPSLTASSYAHPTVSTLMDSVLASHLRRSVFLGAWLLAGGELLRS